MHPEIENLINMALADGEVTEKEKGIIMRKAESLGLDKDEVEMILDGRIALIKKEFNNRQEASINKSNKEGEIKKCPSCGSVVQSFSTKCMDCGHEFRGVDANQLVKQFHQKLLEIENKREDEETNPLKSIGAMLSKSLSGRGLADKVDLEKMQLIKSFPIPNSKEEILEFLSIALPESTVKIRKMLFATIDEDKVKEEMKKVWYTKCEQIIMKARFSMKEDKKTLEEIEYYAKQLGIK
jgi:hypothetical protein